MLPFLVTCHLFVLGLPERLSATATRLGDDDRGQATAEYALVLLGVAAIALAIAVWAAKSGMVSKLLGTVFGMLLKKIA